MSSLSHAPAHSHQICSAKMIVWPKLDAEIRSLEDLKHAGDMRDQGWLSKSEFQVTQCYLQRRKLVRGPSIAKGTAASTYLRCLRGSASKGYDEACFNLGYAHYSGKCGLQKSSEEAIRVLAPAAERGHALSMGFLGAVMCVPGYPLPPPENPNFTMGVHWLRRAAATGDQTYTTNLKSVEDEASRICFKCNSKAPSDKTFLRCSRCRAAWYCSKDCQVQHFRAAEVGHKQFCIKRK